MCTQEEVKEVIEEEFNRSGGLKQQIVSEVKLNLDAEIGKFARRQTLTLAGVVITALGAWFSLYYQVQNIDTQVDKHEDTLATVATKADLERIYTAITRLEDRLFDR